MQLSQIPKQYIHLNIEQQIHSIFRKNFRPQLLHKCKAFY
nr:MAG TPA: hypothetical protein [Bacteriophage sp.]DAH63025.1 MAG TPA: hypothetical protein [Bacteriophage sp.]